MIFDNLDSHDTIDVKQEMLSGVQTGNGLQHDEFNIRGISHAHAYRNFHAMLYL